LIGVFHHPQDVEHLIDDAVPLQATAYSPNGALQDIGD